MSVVNFSNLPDPTLRMYVVAPPKNIQQDLSDDSGSKLSWEASPDTILGYHVYKSSVSIEGPFTRITESVVSGTTFTDTSPANGNNYYMVRAIQLTETPATTFYNPSQAAFFSTFVVGPPQSASPSSPENSPSGLATPNTKASSSPTLNISLLCIVIYSVLSLL
jgi:hypothetical protein